MKTTSASNARKVLKWSIADLIASIFFQDVGLHLSQNDRFTSSSLLTGAEYGPLYAAWHKLHALIVRDKNALHFISCAWLIVLPVELMRRATQSIGSIIPVLVTLGLPIFKVVPHVRLFTAITTFLGFTAAKNQKNANGMAVVVALSGLGSGLARPEFLDAPTMLLLGGLLFAIFFRRKPAPKAILPWVLIAAMGIFISRNDETDSSVVAFEQHFNLRASDRSEFGGEEIPSASKHARDVFFKGKDIEVRQKPSEYVRAHPVAVLEHITENAIDQRNQPQLINSSTRGLAGLQSGATILIKSRGLEQQHQFNDSGVIFDPHGGVQTLTHPEAGQPIKVGYHEKRLCTWCTAPKSAKWQSPQVTQLNSDLELA